jgi:hypothetical protein
MLCGVCINLTWSKPSFSLNKFFYLTITLPDMTIRGFSPSPTWPTFQNPSAESRIRGAELQNRVALFLLFGLGRYLGPLSLAVNIFYFDSFSLIT